MAPELPPEIASQSIFVPVEDISIPVNARKCKPSKVHELAQSIEHDGLLQPIVLRRVPGRPLPPFELVFGGHRLAAHKKLKRPVIEARIIEACETKAIESAMLAENLFRNPLKSTEWIRAMKRWQEIYAAAHPETRGAGRPTSPPEPSLDDSGQPETNLAQLPEPDPQAAKPFTTIVSEKLDVSPTQAKRIARTAKNLSDADLDILEQRGIGVSDVYSLGEIKAPDQRQHAVSLVAAGMEPKLAIAVATSPENATVEHVQKENAPGYKPEAEMTDQEWVEKFCDDIYNRLGNKQAFTADAILWRKTRDALATFAKSVNPILKKPTVQSRTPFRFRLNQIVGIAHPNKWPLCANCGGDGCSSCYGAGYVIKTNGGK